MMTNFAALLAAFTVIFGRSHEKGGPLGMKSVHSPSERLRRMLSQAQEKERLASYLADLVLRHYFEKAESLEGFIRIARGARAKKVARALRVVYRWPDRFGRRLRNQMDALLFATTLDRRTRQLRKRMKRTGSR